MALNWRRNSQPSISGICKSRRTRSGADSWTGPAPSLPLHADTTVWPHNPSAAAVVSRSACSSSTKRMFILFCPPCGSAVTVALAKTMPRGNKGSGQVAKRNLAAMEVNGRQATATASGAWSRVGAAVRRQRRTLCTIRPRPNARPRNADQTTHERHMRHQVQHDQTDQPGRQGPASAHRGAPAAPPPCRRPGRARARPASARPRTAPRPRPRAGIPPA